MRFFTASFIVCKKRKKIKTPKAMPRAQLQRIIHIASVQVCNGCKECNGCKIASVASSAIIAILQLYIYYYTCNLAMQSFQAIHHKRKSRTKGQFLTTKSTKSPPFFFVVNRKNLQHIAYLYNQVQKKAAFASCIGCSFFLLFRVPAIADGIQIHLQALHHLRHHHAADALRCLP